MAVTTFDYIIVGGGSAGCVLANRLTADGRFTVALLEAGPPDNNPLIKMPAGILPLVNGTFCNWKYWSEPQRHLAGRRLFQPRGKTLGGCSSINAQVYVRGNADDFDEWARMGGTGWSYADVLPYFRRSETYAPAKNNDDAGFHGSDGPLHIAERTTLNPLCRAFIEAGQQAGLALNTDFNGARQEGVGVLHSYHEGGQRCSNARAYLFGERGGAAAARNNLTIITDAQATSIILEQGRATGIRYRQGGAEKSLNARREIILSAGAFNSPQLLLLSGIGPRDELARHHIHQRHELPGVGRNLQDHLNVYVVTRSRTRDGLSMHWSALPRALREMARYALFKRGEFSSNLLEAGAFVRSTREQKIPDLQWHFMPLAGACHGHKLDTLKKHYAYSITINDNRPLSRGYLALHSSDPLAPPLIDPNYLAEARDVERLVRGIQLARGVLGQSAFDEYRDIELSPGAAIASDEQLAQWVRANVETVYHPAGTCKMGADAMAVVDPQLRVHGVRGLRVVDASIMPLLISGNTNAAVTMIAEKAAEIILTETKSPAVAATETLRTI